MQALVHFNFDHLGQLIGNLTLLAFEAIKLEFHGVAYLGNFRAEADFLLGSRQLLLLDPAVDASDLRLKVVLHLRDHLVLPLEFGAHD